MASSLLRVPNVEVLAVTTPPPCMVLVAQQSGRARG